MRLEALETRIDEFDERNLVLQAVLGMLSLAGRMDRILDREAPARAEATGAAELHEEDRLLVEFALGAISFRESIGRIVTEAAVRAPRGDTPVPAVVGNDDLFRGVLR